MTATVRRLAHGQQLETGKFYNSHVLFPDILNDGQQRPSDVAAFMYPETGVCQEFGDQCGSRGLSVRTGHSVDLAGAECEKGFHFRSDNNALFACLLQFFVVIVHTRRPEYHIIIGQCIQIAVTQAEFYAQCLKFLIYFSQLFRGLAVQQCDINVFLAKQTDDISVGHTGSDKCHTALLHGFKKMLNAVHRCSSSASGQNSRHDQWDTCLLPDFYERGFHVLQSFQKVIHGDLYTGISVGVIVDHFTFSMIISVFGEETAPSLPMERSTFTKESTHPCPQ